MIPSREPSRPGPDPADPAGAESEFRCRQHKVLAGDDRHSPVNKANLPDTCGRCHSNPALAAKYRFAVAMPVEAYKLSVHGRALARGGKLSMASSGTGRYAFARDTIVSALPRLRP